MAFQGEDCGPEKRSGLTYHGNEIILSKTRGRPVTGLVARGIERGIFPEIKRVEAATTYAVTGSAPHVAELTGIPEATIRSWRKQEWFQAILKEVWSENNELLNTKLTNSIQKAQDLLDDRLDNGDTKVLKDGTLVRVPISGKDLSLITAINFDKRQILRGEPTSRSETVGPGEKVVSKLEQLAETFKALANKTRKPLEGEVVDAEFVEVVDHAPSVGNSPSEGSPQEETQRQA